MGITKVTIKRPTHGTCKYVLRPGTGTEKK